MYNILQMGDAFHDLSPSHKEAVDILLKDVELKPLRARPNVQPCPGDHVSIPFRVGHRTDCWHHGIYMGEVEGKAEPVVIDNSNDRGLHHSLYFSEFGAGRQPVYVIEYEDSPEKREERRRLSQELATMCLENHTNDYHLLVNNCEHLATFCSTGRYGLSIIMSDIIPERSMQTKFNMRDILNIFVGGSRDKSMKYSTAY